MILRKPEIIPSIVEIFLRKLEVTDPSTVGNWRKNYSKKVLKKIFRSVYNHF